MKEGAARRACNLDLQRTGSSDFVHKGKLDTSLIADLAKELGVNESAITIKSYKQGSQGSLIVAVEVVVKDTAAATTVSATAGSLKTTAFTSTQSNFTANGGSGNFGVVGTTASAPGVTTAAPTTTKSGSAAVSAAVAVAALLALLA